MKEKEIWKPIPGFDGYDVSNRGRVRSYHKRIAGLWAIADDPQRILSPGIWSGYQSYNLRQNGKSYQRRAHVLVMLAFIGPRPDGLEVCHNDGDKGNNSLGNLRYDTHQANILESSATKLSNAQVVELRHARADGRSKHKLAMMFSVSRETVNDLCVGRSRVKAGGPITTNREFKISRSTIREIRQQRQSGLSLNKIAQLHSINASTVSYIVRGKRRAKAGGPIEGVDYPIVNPVWHESGKAGALVRHGSRSSFLRIGEG